jgi:hypothetical protein
VNTALGTLGEVIGVLVIIVLVLHILQLSSNLLRDDETPKEQPTQEARRTSSPISSPRRTNSKRSRISRLLRKPPKTSSKRNGNRRSDHALLRRAGRHPFGDLRKRRRVAGEDTERWV